MPGKAIIEGKALSPRFAAARPKLNWEGERGRSFCGSLMNLSVRCCSQAGTGEVHLCGEIQLADGFNELQDGSMKRQVVGLAQAFCFAQSLLLPLVVVINLSNQLMRL